MRFAWSNSDSSARADGSQKVIEQWNSFAADYDQRFVANYSEAYALFGQNMAQAARLNSKPATVIDLACGSGWTLQFLAALGISSYFGIDISTQMIKVASERAKYKFPVHFAPRSAEALCNPVFCEEFLALLGAKPDLIICNAALHEIQKVYPDIDLILAQISRLLVSGGHLLIGDFFYSASSSLSDIASSARWIKNVTTEDPTAPQGFIQPLDLMQRLERLGFSVLKGSICRASAQTALEYYSILCVKRDA